ncbi:AEC family transporter [Clostridium sediminicola]|uniref:AEC family transporter n=1 Tax=Clostridium sediminicola TaxID=3114879 RepID=UPI0031F23F55
MLDNFVFSISIVMPICFVMCVGYILKRKNIIDNNFTKTANTIVYNVALPIKLFNDVSKTSLDACLDVKFIAFTTLGTLLSILIIWIIGLVFIKKKSQLGAFIHCCFRGNFVYIGLTFIENITGSIGLKASLIIAFVIPLYNIMAIIILTYTDQSRTSKIRAKDIINSIFRNPLIIGIVLGIVYSLVGLELPIMAERTLNYFDRLVTPLALITVGSSFDFMSSVENLKPSILASIIKLFILPLIMVTLAIRMGFPNEDIVLIYILFGVPSTLGTYMITAAMNGDKELAANIIMLTTILSTILMTLFVFGFKTIGII